MEKKTLPFSIDDGNVRKFSDEDYWQSAHKGFDFNENSWSLSIPPSGLGHLSSSIRENDALNQYDLLRCDGLSEVAENKTSSDDVLTSHILTAEEEKQAQKIAKSCNPLEFNLKENFGDKILNAEQTIRNIVLGLDYSLKPFKGKDEKFDLLNAAVQSHDGNAILTVVMFLKNTLKRSIFQREISLYPDAINMYLSYLYEDHEVDELSNMLLLLNKPEDAAMLKYDAAILIRAPDRKIKLIENSLKPKKESEKPTQNQEKVFESPPPPAVNAWEQRAKAQAEKKNPLPLFVPRQVSLNQSKASNQAVQPEPIPSTSQTPHQSSTQASPDIFTQLRDPEVVDLFQSLQDFIHIAKTHNTRSARLSALLHYVYNDIIQ
ncbi:spermatogenesis-defective protein 39-like protein [Trichonephila clavipes]|nr:spermatogenesis-defective protein 39-like protein [Trichonephila clavipes]